MRIILLITSSLMLTVRTMLVNCSRTDSRKDFAGWLQQRDINSECTGEFVMVSATCCHKKQNQCKDDKPDNDKNLVNLTDSNTNQPLHSQSIQEENQ